MSKNDLIMHRLESSILDLKRAVEDAKPRVSESYHYRLLEYDKLIETQEEFIVELRKALELENTTEIPRLVNLINGISDMIKQDARSILKEIEDTK